MAACSGTSDQASQASVATIHLDVQNQDISRGPAKIVVTLDDKIIFDRVVQPFESPSPKVDVPLGPGPWTHVVVASAPGAAPAEAKVLLDAKRWVVVDLWPVNSDVDHPEMGINRYDAAVPR